LMAALRDGEEEARRQAALRLGGFPGEEAVEALTAAALEDDSPGVRAAAAVSLWRASGPRLLDILAPALRGEDKDRREKALQALARVKDAGGLADWRPAIALRLQVTYLLALIRWRRDADQIWRLTWRSAVGCGLGWLFGLYLALALDPVRAQAALFGAVTGFAVGLLAGGGFGLGIGLAGSLWPRRAVLARLAGTIFGGVIGLVPALYILAGLTDQPAANGALAGLLLSVAFALGLVSRSRITEVVGGTAGPVIGLALADALGLLNLGGPAMSAAVGALVGLGTTLGIVWGKTGPAIVGVEA
jgi:hypothetical protein